MLKNIIHNTVFRIFTPIFYGVIMYILILLIFDSIQQLSENFFSIEVFLCVIITYLIFEVLRLFALLVEKKCPLNCSIAYRILMQAGVSMLIAFTITAFIISFYFSKLVGFNSYQSELTVFTTIFVLTSILYNMIYFSFFYLNRVNISQLEQENILKENVKIELDTYKNKINSNFLYDSLESLISLIKRDKDEADKLILKLSDVYRNILSNKKSELINLDKEIEISKTLIQIFNYKYNGALSLTADILTENANYQIISGTLVVIIEDIVNRSIISNIQTLEINCKIEKDILIISHPIQNKLIEIFTKKMEIKQLKTAYLYYSNKSIEIDDNDTLRNYSIPIFEIKK